MKLIAILASHNRRQQTLACLASYFGQEAGDVQLAAVLVDDGSTDGTASEVRDQFRAADVIEEDGGRYWAGAMAIAEAAALRMAPDYLLWLNDDVILDEGALHHLLETSRAHGDAAIVVGAVRHPQTGELTYSGVRRTGWHPLRFERVEPADQPVPIETFNGNVVLVPRGVAEAVGGFDGEFVHAAADFDYGLRAAQAGVTNLLASGTVGTCAPNLGGQPWRDRSTSIQERLSALLGPKGAPPAARARYLRRHGGPVWPVFWIASYLRAAGDLVRPGKPDPTS